MEFQVLCYLIPVTIKSNSLKVKSVNILVSIGPRNINSSPIAMNLGTNVNVCSCIDVVAWSILIIRPTKSETIRNGSDRIAV